MSEGTSRHATGRTQGESHIETMQVEERRFDR